MNTLNYLTKYFETNYAIYLFFIVLILIHISIIIIPKSRKSKKFWLILDYIYYGIGLMGLLGLYTNARITIANYEKQYLPQSIEGILYTARDYSVIPEKYLNTFTYKDMNKTTLQEYKKFKTYYKIINAKLSIPFKEKKWLDILQLEDPYKTENNTSNLCLLLERNQEYCNKVWIEPYIQIKHKINYSKNKLEILMKLNSSDHRDIDEIFFSLLAPFLIAFAMGIRISKITAELVGYRREEI